MNRITCYFADTMVDSLIEKGVNIISIQDADVAGQKLVEIEVSKPTELFSIFSAGIDWMNKMTGRVGS